MATFDEHKVKVSAGRGRCCSAAVGVMGLTGSRGNLNWGGQTLQDTTRHSVLCRLCIYLLTDNIYRLPGVWCIKASLVLIPAQSKLDFNWPVRPPPLIIWRQIFNCWAAAGTKELLVVCLALYNNILCVLWVMFVISTKQISFIFANTWWAFDELKEKQYHPEIWRANFVV